MKLYLYLSFVLTLAVCSQLVAQEAQQQTVLEQQKEAIIAEEREALKAEVEAINQQLDNKEITSEEAQQLKEAAAEKRALNIENRIAIAENEAALSKRNESIQKEEQTTNQHEESYALTLFGDEKVIWFGRSSEKKERKYDRRTYSDFVFAFGFNNVITEGESIDDSQFKIGGSRFAELGWAWKTRVFKNSNWLRIKYGVSFQLNGLKPIDNQYFVQDGDQTVLEEFPHELRKSKLRMDHLVFPIHFEFGPSKKIENEDYFRYSTKRKLKVGLGGYAGFNIGVRQKLKYSDDDGRQKDKFKRNYNTNNFIYGLSGYIGWNYAALYVKYDLNTIFKDNPVDQHNVSVGLRFDFD